MVINTKYQILNTKYLLGFTLIEVLVAVAIIAVAVAGGGWAYLSAIDKQHLSSAVNLVVSYSQEAQNDSITVKNGSRYGVSYYDKKLEIFKDQPGNTTYTYQLPNRMLLSEITLANGGSLVNFAKLTGRPDTAGELTLESRFFEAMVIIDKSGNISGTEIVKK